MEQTIVSILLIIFVMLGVIHVVRLISLLLLRPPGKYNYSLVIPLSGHCEDIEYVTRSVSERIDWSSRSSMEIILLNCGADDETVEICKRICSQRNDISLIDRDSIGTYFDL